MGGRWISQWLTLTFRGWWVKCQWSSGSLMSVSHPKQWHISGRRRHHCSQSDLHSSRTVLHPHHPHWPGADAFKTKDTGTFHLFQTQQKARFKQWFFLLVHILLFFRPLALQRWVSSSWRWASRSSDSTGRAERSRGSVLTKEVLSDPPSSSEWEAILSLLWGDPHLRWDHFSVFSQPRLTDHQNPPPAVFLCSAYTAQTEATLD